MKPKRLGRGLSGLIKSSEPKTLPPSRIQRPGAAEPADRSTADAQDGGEAGVVTPDVRAADAPASTLEAAQDTVEDGSAGGAVALPVAQPVATGVRELPVGDIRPNPFQPRSIFGEADLTDLMTSIGEHGLLQPVVVRRGGAGFELIVGERRLRAVRALGWDRIPAVVRPAQDQEMQTLALVENLQRVDLNAIEKARSLKAMMRNFGLTQEEVAARVGKARTSISNLVRLLDLPGVIQDMISAGDLTGSQARAILLAHGAERRIALAQRAAREGLTVRKIEQLARAERRGPRELEDEDPFIKDLEGRMREALGTRVRLAPRGQGGTITIGYHDAEELDRLLERFGAS